MYAVIDMGTTNTRVFILDKKKAIVGRAYIKKGVRDTAVSGRKDELVLAIQKCAFQALKNAKVELADIQYIFVSGMLTSEIGLIDLPHLIAPVGLTELVENLKVADNIRIFPIDIPIIFVRGVRNDYKEAALSKIRFVDFMRGEETQIIGILNTVKPALPCNIMMFSSHTKIFHIDEKGRIAGSLTSLSGQIFEAIIQKTFIGKSVKVEDIAGYEDFFSEDILRIVYESIKNAGFLRTIMMPRFMEVLLKNNAFERKFFLEAAIACEDIKIVDEMEKINFDTGKDFIFVGHQKRCMLYERLFKLNGRHNAVYSIFNKDKIDLLTVNGAGQILEQAENKGIVLKIE